MYEAKKPCANAQPRVRLWNKDFSLVVIGQIISLFANAALRLALSLYILEVTGSATIFGTILALSIIPTVLLTPFGGIAADRLNKRNIMVFLDFLTAALTGILSFLLTEEYAVVSITVSLMLLSVIQSFYTPSVQSSIPFLQERENLVKANAVVNQVTMLANIAAPLAGALLYGPLGAKNLVLISAVFFFCSAVMEIFIHIPFKKQAAESNLFKMVKNDFSESLKWLCKEGPISLRLVFSFATINLLISAIIISGLPFFIKNVLMLGDSLFGIASALIGCAGVLGGVIAGVLSDKIKPSKLHALYIGMGLSLLPGALGFFFQLPPMAVYVLLTAGIMIGQIAACIISIILIASVQEQTPPTLLGKVMALIASIAQCAIPLGTIIYGFLFDNFRGSLHVPLFGAIICIAAAGMFFKKDYERLDSVPLT